MSEKEFASSHAISKVVRVVCLHNHSKFTVSPVFQILMQTCVLIAPRLKVPPDPILLMDHMVDVFAGSGYVSADSSYLTFFSSVCFCVAAPHQTQNQICTSAAHAPRSMQSHHIRLARVVSCRPLPALPARSVRVILHLHLRHLCLRAQFGPDLQRWAHSWKARGVAFSWQCVGMFHFKTLTQYFNFPIA